MASNYYANKNREPGVATLLLSGMISSSIAMSFTYPIGFVRTRL
jgi:hypothetical protein